MPRKRDGFVPLGDVAEAVELPGESPARPSHFTRLDQVTQLVGARDADSDVGFQARMMALCSLPRTNPATGFSTSGAMGLTHWRCSQGLTTSCPTEVRPAC